MKLGGSVADTRTMELVTETSAGPLELLVRQVGGATSVQLATGDTWNSMYTPVPLAAFLADFARLPDAEAEQLSKRVLNEWEASPESEPPTKRTTARKGIAPFGPSVVLVFLTVAAFGAIVYFVVRSLLMATTG
jgi:hypothetical protein